MKKPIIMFSVLFLVLAQNQIPVYIPRQLRPECAAGLEVGHPCPSDPTNMFNYGPCPVGTKPAGGGYCVVQYPPLHTKIVKEHHKKE